MHNLMTALRRGALCLALAAGTPATTTAADWPSAGHDLANSRQQLGEFFINRFTVPALRLKWTVPTDGDVTATPAVDGDYLYFPDSAGFLYKVNRWTGALAWKYPVSKYTGIAGDFARATPAVSGNTLILGNGSGKFLAIFGQPAPQPAQVFAVDKNTGERLWSTQVDDTQLSFVTNSAIVANGLAVVGITSNEELMAGFVPPPAWQWSFRGSVVALDVRTGSIRWKTYTVPPGYYGGAVWGSTGAVNLLLNQVYIATGNNYAVPDTVLSCIHNGGNLSTCLDPADRFDSIIALNLSTGRVNWAAHGLPYDAWNVGCGLYVPGVFNLPPNGNCPNPQGPDWDFAQGPMMFGLGLVGAGQKSGMFWAFREIDGKLAWSTQAAPGGLTGGLQWGSATDGARIFFAAANSGPTGSALNPQPWKLKNGGTTTAGGWGALNAFTGDTLWTTPDPRGSRAEGAVSLAGGLVFGCNLAFGVGTMYALDAASGAPLWSYDSGAMCNAGPAIADAMVYWGSGTFAGTGAHKVFAFGF
jgi:polyvinyl alcohol dehydrogenase (cytochrome)